MGRMLLLRSPRAVNPARRGRFGLVLCLAVAGAVAESAGVHAAGMIAARGATPEATALLPFAAFDDLRWVLVFANSWPAVAGELALAVALRSAFTAVVVRAAWPGDLPPWWPLLGRCALADLVVMVAMSPWATLAFMAGAVSLSWPLLAGFAGALITATVLVPHAGIAPRWWVRLPPWRAMSWSAASVLALTMAAVGMDYSPGPAALFAVAVGGGAVNGLCWWQLVTACAEADLSRTRARTVATPAGTAIAFLVLIVVAGFAVTRVLHSVAPPRRHAQAPPARGQHVVLSVEGFESDWSGGSPGITFPGFYTTEFSYRGQARDGRPLPYASPETHAALPVLGRRLAAQVDRLRALSGRRVDVVAESEGTLVLRRYLASHRHAPLGTVVLASPLVRPARVWYPPEGREGWGVAGGAESRALLALASAIDPRARLRADMPMVRSLIANAPLYRQHALCPARGVHVIALLPLTAALTDPPGPVGGVPDAVVPAPHATLLGRGSVRRVIDEALRGRPLSRYFGWGLGFQLVRYSASAWETPSLPLGLVPTSPGRRATGTDAAFGSYGCPARGDPSSLSRHVRRLPGRLHR